MKQRLRNTRWPRGAITLASVAALAALAAAPARSGQSAPKPLFASDATLQLRIEAPFTDLIKAAPRSTNAFDAKLIVSGPAAETLTIKLSPRGISRRHRVSESSGGAAGQREYGGAGRG